jgi:hypothetical protein
VLLVSQYDDRFKSRSRHHEACYSSARSGWSGHAPAQRRDGVWRATPGHTPAKNSVAECPLPIHGRERLSHLPRGGGIALAQGHTDNFATLAIEGQPQPAVVLLAADERPKFVPLDG